VGGCFDWLGHFISNRSGASAEQTYYNGSSVATSSNASSAILNRDFVILANNDFGTINFGCGNTIAAYSFGRSLTAAEATKFYNRMRALGNALGWP
jgi:hypothetical protein